jgi:hypothetical protein
MQVRALLVCMLVGVLLVTGSGCAVMQPIPPSTNPAQPGYSRIESGQYVVLDLRDGRQVEFVVDRVEPDGIVAVGGTRYANTEIARASRRRLTKGEALVVGVLVGAGIFVVLFAIAVGEAVGSQW